MLFIVSTAVKVGKGGISSALVGFTESRALQQHGFVCVTSHQEGEKKATYQRAKQCLQENASVGDAVWLHCGPWLSMLRKWKLGRIAQKSGASVFYHFHSPKVASYLKHRVGRWLIRRMLTSADGVMVLTPWWKRQFEQAFPNLNCPIEVIGNPLGTTFQQASEAPRTNPTSSQKKLLTMARLVPEKGVAEVIQALQLLPTEYQLTIAGTGPQMDALQALVTQLELTERVTFVGWVNYDDKLALMNAADSFCLPSRYDSFGMAFIEAMAVGLPVVALRQGAVPDVVLDGQTGILVDTAEADALAQAIVHATENKQNFGAAGKAWVKSEYNNEVLSHRLLTFISNARSNHEL